MQPDPVDLHDLLARQREWGQHEAELNRVKWDMRWLRQAQSKSAWSKDPSTQVGAVIADGKRELGHGYNGFPKGFPDNRELYGSRDFKYPHVVHAEINAILQAGGSSARGTLYVWPIAPCPDCMKVIMQTDVSRIVSFWLPPEDERHERWSENLELARHMWTRVHPAWSYVLYEQHWLESETFEQGWETRRIDPTEWLSDASRCGRE